MRTFVNSNLTKFIGVDYVLPMSDVKLQFTVLLSGSPSGHTPLFLMPQLEYR